VAELDLDARYGRTPAAARRTRWVVAASGVAFVAVFAAWLVWGGLLEAPAQFEARDTGYSIDSDAQVTVTWEFSAQPGTAARCAVQALNSTFGIVGWHVVDLPPSEQRTRSFSDTLRTTERAVTGLIYRCWLT
jgi:hypothetical protein